MNVERDIMTATRNSVSASIETPGINILDVSFILKTLNSRSVLPHSLPPTIPPMVYSENLSDSIEVSM